MIPSCNTTETCKGTWHSTESIASQVSRAYRAYTYTDHQVHGFLCRLAEQQHTCKLLDGFSVAASTALAQWSCSGPRLNILTPDVHIQAACLPICNQNKNTFAS
jgi:hypothetical protein